ncbi:MAG: hypothetical protein IJ787_00055 [Bacilli bacterium]|nr:hypothetical protein [Bacilli bacterium]
MNPPSTPLAKEMKRLLDQGRFDAARECWRNSPGAEEFEGIGLPSTVNFCLRFHSASGLAIYLDTMKFEEEKDALSKYFAQRLALMTYPFTKHFEVIVGASHTYYSYMGDDLAWLQSVVLSCFTTLSYGFPSTRKNFDYGVSLERYIEDSKDPFACYFLLLYAKPLFSSELSYRFLRLKCHDLLIRLAFEYPEDPYPLIFMGILSRLGLGNFQRSDENCRVLLKAARKRCPYPLEVVLPGLFK